MNASQELELPGALMSPAGYPWNPDKVELIETHISWVFLAGDYLLKIKRPVQFGFIDHSTLEARRLSCEAEIFLNRRLTSGVYIDIVPISSTSNQFVVGGAGNAIEWGTLMKRLPADRMLDRLIRDGAVPPDLAERLATRLIPFHQMIAGPCAGLATGRTDRLMAVVTDNISELIDAARGILPAGQLALLSRSIHHFIDAHRDELERRTNDGFVRDGHGDLRCEHVCLDGDDVQIFDCVEFSSEIRCADIASDLAFLLMDLERLGVAQVAHELEQRYRAAGVDLPSSLVNFYRTHRALVRAKVDCLTLIGEHQHRESELTASANAYLELAMRYGTSVSPAMIVMTGLSGTGKSTLAKQLALLLRAKVFASDIVRKELAGVSGEAASDWGQGIYTEEWNLRTYRRSMELAADELAKGRPVIVDAAFLSDDERELASSVATDMDVPMVLVETVCDPAIAEERLRARSLAANSPSDANVAIYRRQRERYDANAPSIPGNAHHVRVDTATPSVAWTDDAVKLLIDVGVLTAEIPSSE